MFKKHVWVLSFLAAIVLSACSDQQGNYLEAIPSDALFASKINVGQMVTKSEIMKEETVTNGLQTVSAMMSEDTRDLFDKVFKDPEMSGIDVNKPIAVAVAGIFPNPSGVFTIALKDADNFEKFLGTLLADPNAKMADIALNKKEKYTAIETNGSVIAAFDAYKLVICIAQNSPDATPFMELQKSNQAIQDSRFESFFADNADIVFFYNYEKIIAMANMASGMVGSAPLNISTFKDMTATINFDFVKGAIKSATNVQFGEELKKLAEANARKSTMAQLKYVPANATFAATCGIGDITEGLKLMGKNYTDQLNETLSHDNLEINDLKAIQGDITLALLPFQSVLGKQIPMPVLYVSLQDRKFFDVILNAARNAEMANTITEDVYSLDIQGQTTGICFGYKENTFFVMPTDLYKQVLASGAFTALENNVTSHRLASQLNENSFFFDAEAFFKDPYMADFCENVPFSVSATFDYAAGKQTDLASAEFELAFQNKQDNALKIIKDLVMSCIK